MSLYTLNFKSVTDYKKEVKISGYASVFGAADYHEDIIVPGAFADSIAKHYQGSTIKFLWQHDHNKPIGIINNITEDSTGLFVEASINKDLMQSQEIISLVMQGAVDSFSIGFNIQKSIVNHEGKREILKADLWEVSIVTFPANSQAKIYRIHSRPKQIVETVNWKLLGQVLSNQSIFKL